MTRNDIEKACNVAWKSEGVNMVDFAIQQINAVIDEVAVALDEQVTWSDYDPSETAVEVIRRFKMEAK